MDNPIKDRFDGYKLKLNNGKIVEVQSHQCPFCGSRTGLHGFSFGKDGKYHD